MSKDTNSNTGESLKEGTKLYELAFNLIPQVGDEGAISEPEKIKKIIEDKEGKVVAESKPALISLAYTMVKKQDTKNVRYDNAYFGWFKFEGSADSLSSIKEDLDLDTNILRYMITNTVKETDTPSSSLVEDKEKRDDKTYHEKKKEVVVEKDATEDEKKEVVDETKVDEAIDDLVKEEK